jgi:chromosomal replication initiation ATPase DnaA
MKSKIFDNYVDNVANVFSITREDLFTKNKDREICTARFMLYYLCYKRNMILSYIQKSMLKNGYNVYHSTVSYGIKNIIERLEIDPDYVTLIKKLEQLN